VQVASPAQRGPITQAPASLGVCTQHLRLASGIAPSWHALGFDGAEVSAAASRWDAVLWAYLGMALGDTLLVWKQAVTCNVCLPYSTDEEEKQQVVALNSLISA